MQISGDGFTTFDAAIKPNFKAVTIPALEWYQMSDGNYKAIDRGAASDVYRTNIEMYGQESRITEFIEAVEGNRTNGSNTITLANFADGGEEIFGKDVDYSGVINASVVEITKREMGSFKGFGINFVLQAISPTFGSYTNALPDLKYLEVGYSSDNELTITKYDTYNGQFYAADREADIGFFEGTFKVSNADMGQLRRYIATQRGSDYTISTIPGVAYPFGPRRGTTFPITAKLIEWEDLGQWGLHYWKIKLKFAEVI